MALIYGIPTYNRHNELPAIIRKIEETSTLKPDAYWIVDNAGMVAQRRCIDYEVEAYEALDNERYTPFIGALADLACKVRIVANSHNCVARAWNLMRYELPSPAIQLVIANDDVVPHPRTLETLYNAVVESPMTLHCGASSSGNAFSLFAISHALWRTVGPFDERFVPAYFEDNDYAYRLSLRGYNLHIHDHATYDHVGSATIKALSPAAMNQHHNNFRKAQQYYIEKWGGLPGSETYKTEFNQ